MAGEEAPAGFAEFCISGGIGVDRGRELDGGRAAAVGERAGAGAAARAAMKIRGTGHAKSVTAKLTARVKPSGSNGR